MVTELTGIINQTLFILFSEIIEADLEDFHSQEEIITKEVKDDSMFPVKSKTNHINPIKCKDDFYFQSQISDRTEVSQRVLYLLDFINHLVSQHPKTNNNKKPEVPLNLDTLNCFMVLYYTVPTHLKSKIVASLFTLVENNQNTCNHDLLACFVLKELVNEHYGDFKLSNVKSVKQDDHKARTIVDKKTDG